MFKLQEGVLPEGVLRGGGGCGSFGRGRDGALILLTQCVSHGVTVWCSGSTVLRSWLVANGLHSRTEQNRQKYYYYCITADLRFHFFCSGLI